MINFLDKEGVEILWGKVKGLVEGVKTTVKDLQTNLSNLEQKVDKAEVQLSTVYSFAGSVETFDDLRSVMDPKVGDVYDVKESGMNYAWTGKPEEYEQGWDPLGMIFNVRSISKEELDKILVEE